MTAKTESGWWKYTLLYLLVLNILSNFLYKVFINRIFSAYSFSARFPFVCILGRWVVSELLVFLGRVWCVLRGKFLYLDNHGTCGWVWFVICIDCQSRFRFLRFWIDFGWTYIKSISMIVNYCLVYHQPPLFVLF